MQLDVHPSTAPLTAIEPRLRLLLPADLYTAVWVDPNPANLMRVFEHLRTFQRILSDYMPRQVAEHPSLPGKTRYAWQEGTLLFTDLAGFTPLMEATAANEQQGASLLLNVLNHYFSEMIEIISKSGGDLLEFTGDAMLVQFLADSQRNDLAQAVRAGLRMQRAMAHFSQIETKQGQFSLGMRVGIHTGRFLTADIGTPMRMVHVLLGRTVQQAKQVEGAGYVGRVCVTGATNPFHSPLLQERLKQQFRFEPVPQAPVPCTEAASTQTALAEYVLVNDDLTAEQLGEYDISLNRRRLASALLIDRSVTGLLAEIQELVKRVEPLASYLPSPILNLLVENAAQRQIPPNFPKSIVVFVNLVGFPESVDTATPDELDQVIASFSRVFAYIDAAVRTQGGILQKVTYQQVGSDILIYFGALGARTEEAIRAADAAIAIREIVAHQDPPVVNGNPVPITCRIGLTDGPVFAAEIGEPRGRREFNILGDPVNTAARLMKQAIANQILITEPVYSAIAHRFTCNALGSIALKGKAQPTPIFALRDRHSEPAGVDYRL